MKNSRILWVFILVLLLTVGAAAAGSVKGSGNLRIEERSVGDFHGVSLMGSPDVTITVGGPTSLSVEAEDNILPLLTTEVVNGILEIGSEKSFSTRKGIHVTLTVPELRSVAVIGSGDIVAEGVSGDLFKAMVKGSGDIEVTGSVERVEVDVLGSGDIKLFGLDAVHGEATVKGSGDIDIQASGTLELSVLGSGDIRHRGSAEVHKEVHGSGDISAD
ncbi:MAG: DUF2807 domain-containing protein [Acidobacteria bacterium]|uniref:DUF2807 domain-containing protein n=1 Tax=Candidatus Polarisedimenticola svalbardensis TaxID=2886004 RepID=A0A8J6XTK1_9BACT|nr:DUF2807 domain-containing protein [Candidatus Polarisedimenticola svalbardensis]